MGTDVYGTEAPVQASWPDLTCYGCGPANEQGHHLESYLGDDGETLVATVRPDALFNSGAPNVMYGGHVASLVDCHSIRTATTFAYREEGRAMDSDPRISYVTGRLTVTYLKPTPLDEPIHLRAWVDGGIGRRTVVRCELGPEGRVTATGELLAVRVDQSAIEGHHQARHPSGVVDA